MTKKVYTKDILDCEEEAKRILNKRYATKEVIFLTLKLWNESKVEKEAE